MPTPNELLDGEKNLVRNCMYGAMPNKSPEGFGNSMGTLFLAGIRFVLQDSVPMKNHILVGSEMGDGTVLDVKSNCTSDKRSKSEFRASGVLQRPAMNLKH
jgi:hypothetical protein